MSRPHLKSRGTSRSETISGLVRIWLANMRPKRRAAQNFIRARSEEHTSELQSRRDLVCRLLLEKKKKDGKVDTGYPDNSWIEGQIETRTDPYLEYRTCVRGNAVLAIMHEALMGQPTMTSANERS